jgi:hypothetical protein
MTADEQKLAKALGQYIMASEPVWPAISAAAAAGNAGQENLFRPVTTGPKDHGSDGLWQWRLSRLDELKSWCVSKGFDWTYMESQVAFMKFEMMRDYPALWVQLVNPGNRPLENLTANFMEIYERPDPALAGLDNRIRYAREVYAMLGHPEPPPVPPAPAPPASSLPVPAPSVDLTTLMTRLQQDHDLYNRAQKTLADAVVALNAAKQQLTLDLQAVQNVLDQTKELTK